MPEDIFQFDKEDAALFWIIEHIFDKRRLNIFQFKSLQCQTQVHFLIEQQKGLFG